ncbi:MAG: hypothetical protein KBS93_11020 [Flavobacteriaceae bacterium]|nr:hypothetical protein [Candidatus Onthonaster equi]
MQHQLILSFILSLVFTNFSFAQNDTVKNVNDTITPIKNPRHLYIGVDLALPAQALFTDKQGAQAFISYQIKPKWHAIVEVGYEKNIYNETSWNVDVDGIFAKIGANWFITQEAQNPANGFYVGGRLVYSSYNQKINSYPIRDIYSNEIVGEGSKEKASVNSYWAEVVIGGRVELYKKLYADFSIHPSVNLGGKKQENITPLVIPGYGRNNGPFNLPIFWGISYQLF